MIICLRLFVGNLRRLLLKTLKKSCEQTPFMQCLDMTNRVVSLANDVPFTALRIATDARDGAVDNVLGDSTHVELLAQGRLYEPCGGLPMGRGMLIRFPHIGVRFAGQDMS